MPLFPDFSAVAEALIPALETQFNRSKLDLERARSKLFALISPPDALEDGEEYDVDIAADAFEVFHGDRKVAASPLQVIGTYLSSEGTWLWAWNNPSFAQHASTSIADFIHARPELEGIRECVKFQADESFCEQMAQWIAVKAGWLGAYPGQYDETIVFLAVRPQLLDPAGNHTETLWCSLCGRTQAQVDKLISSGPDCAAAVCSGCAIQAAEIAAEMQDPTETHPGLPACLLCGEAGPRVFTDYSSLCLECMKTIREILAR